jgi:large subunit ribosomal protein L31
MKEKIHPNYGITDVTCTCGNTFQTRSTVPGKLQIEICSKCHSFYTGKFKMMDSAGRVERFLKKYRGVSPKKKSKAVAESKAESKAESVPKA